MWYIVLVFKGDIDIVVVFFSLWRVFLIMFFFFEIWINWMFVGLLFGWGGFLEIFFCRIWINNFKFVLVIYRLKI